MPVTTRDVAAVQRCYPKIYLACHTKHQRRRSNAAQLTAHESSLLAHLSEAHPTRPSDLAKHLGIGRSTVSAAVKRLVALGYIAHARAEDDGRVMALRLSPKGAKAMQAGSVLESGRVKALLAQLTERERGRAIEGLELLARAAGSLPSRKESAS
jgi:MarR family transcriptional regulator, organic hydroperoxide resistance regulator